MSGRSTEPKLQDIAKALEPFLPPGWSAVVFGSRASGQARTGSDWDIGLLGPMPIGGAVVEKARDALEGLRTLHSFDVVDLATVPEGFRRQALSRIVRLT
jgi:predicted nucleotidyltransferase